MNNVVEDLDDVTFETLSKVAGVTPSKAAQLTKIARRAREIIDKRKGAPMIVKKSGIVESARQKKKRSKKKRAYDKLVNTLNPPYKVF